MPEKAELVVEGKKLAVSNLNKVLYPKVGFTKGQVIDYYIRIAPVLLPHLRDRPLTMKRYPNGVDAEFFYEKNCPSHRPKWVQTASEATTRRGTSVRTKGFPNGGVMLSTWAAQPRPTSNDPGPLHQAGEGDMELVGEERSRRYAGDHDAGRIELGKGSERLDRNTLVVRDAHQRAGRADKHRQDSSGPS